MDDLEARIHDLAERHFDSGVSGLEELSGGASHHTYAVDLENGEEYVFKLSNYDWSGLPDYEHGFPIDGPVLRFLSGKDFLPTPEVFFFDNSEEEFDFKYLIAERIEGENMYVHWDLIDLSLVEEAGRKLARLHDSTGFEDHGKLGYRSGGEELFVDKSENWPEMFSGILEKLADNLEDTRFSNYSEEVLKLFEENKNILRDDPPAKLVHQEYSPRNIMYRDNSVAGVLDWERAVSADPEYDLFNAERHFTAKTNLMEGTSQTADEIQKAFRRGYREIRDLEDGWQQRRKLYHLVYVVQVMWVLEDEIDSQHLTRQYRELRRDLKEV